MGVRCRLRARRRRSARRWCARARCTRRARRTWTRSRSPRPSSCATWPWASSGTVLSSTLLCIIPLHSTPFHSPFLLSPRVLHLLHDVQFVHVLCSSKLPVQEFHLDRVLAGLQLSMQEVRAAPLHPISFPSHISSTRATRTQSVNLGALWLAVHRPLHYARLRLLRDDPRRRARQGARAHLAPPLHRERAPAHRPEGAPLASHLNLQSRCHILTEYIYSIGYCFRSSKCRKGGTLMRPASSSKIPKCWTLRMSRYGSSFLPAKCYFLIYLFKLEAEMDRTERRGPCWVSSEEAWLQVNFCLYLYYSYSYVCICTVNVLVQWTRV